MSPQRLRVGDVVGQKIAYPSGDAVCLWICPEGYDEDAPCPCIDLDMPQVKAAAEVLRRLEYANADPYEPSQLELLQAQFPCLKDNNCDHEDAAFGLCANCQSVIEAMAIGVST